MSSTSTGSAMTNTYLDHSSTPDVDFDEIKSRSTCAKFRDSAWGFVIYRCAQGTETAWARLLEALHSSIKESLRYYIRQDMLDLHYLHVIDDETLYGATIDQVRDHFCSWVPKDQKSRLRPDATNLQEDIDWVFATSTPRYEYCLFVDDICLESVDYKDHSLDFPAVKILWKRWESPFPPEERNYTIPTPFHDGATEDWEEDVGWMYMPTCQYIEKYELLTKWDWEDQYVRPPYITGFETEGSFVGHWRQKSLGEKA